MHSLTDTKYQDLIENLQAYPFQPSYSKIPNWNPSRRVNSDVRNRPSPLSEFHKFINATWAMKDAKRATLTFNRDRRGRLRYLPERRRIHRNRFAYVEQLEEIIDQSTVHLENIKVDSATEQQVSQQ